jgi:branched-chain amino acid transport system permease protein
VLDLERSASVLIMLVLGGTGRLYGAFIGAALFMLMQDYLARRDPMYWQLWIGCLLVAVVLLGRGGILGIAEALRAQWAGRRAR